MIHTSVIEVKSNLCIGRVPIGSKLLKQHIAMIPVLSSLCEVEIQLGILILINKIRVIHIFSTPVRELIRNQNQISNNHFSFFSTPLKVHMCLFQMVCPSLLLRRSAYADTICFANPEVLAIASHGRIPGQELLKRDAELRLNGGARST